MTARQWTPERRQRQAELIHRWAPWKKSTGPKTCEGKAVVSRNAFKNALGPQLRAISKQMNEVLREQRAMLRRIQ